jgi:hypothetical protein
MSRSMGRDIDGESRDLVVDFRGIGRKVPDLAVDVWRHRT